MGKLSRGWSHASHKLWLWWGQSSDNAQGRVLSTTFYSYFMKDLTKVRRKWECANSEVRMFADDYTMINSICNANGSNDNNHTCVQQDLDNVPEKFTQI